MGESEHKKGGNSLLFGILLITNILLLVLGIVVLSIGIYSCEENKNFSSYNGSFIFIGLISIIAGFIGHLIRYSPFYLFIYEISLIILGIMHLIFTILAFNDAHLNLDKSDNDLFQYVLIQQELNIVACFILAGWYWKTLELENKHQELRKLRDDKSPFI